MSLTLSETPKTGFIAMRPKFMLHAFNSWYSRHKPMFYQGNLMHQFCTLNTFVPNHYIIRQMIHFWLGALKVHDAIDIIQLTDLSFKMNNNNVSFEVRLQYKMMWCCTLENGDFSNEI